MEVTALDGVQQEQSTLQNTQTWNTTNFQKFLVLKEFEGCLMNPTLLRLSKVHHH